MSDRKIRMATGDDPREQGHTIVGGRPAGNASRGKDIPRGMEALVMKAAVDQAFMARLVSERSRLADELQVPLDPAERAMLDGIPAPQLQEIVRHTRVPETQRSLLAGGSAAALIALVTQLTFAPVAGRAEPADQGAGTVIAQNLPNAGVSADPPIEKRDFPQQDGGVRPDFPIGGGARPEFPMPPGGARPDLPDEPDKVTRGIRPDLPIRPRPPAPPPVETPSPTSETLSPTAAPPFSLDTLKQVAVTSEAAGKSYLEAILMITSETRVPISYAGTDGLDLTRPVSTSTKGVPLGKALRRLCEELAGAGALYEIEVLDDKIRIQFKSGVGGGNPGGLAPKTEPAPPEGQDAKTLGIRPDLPPRRP